MILAIQIILLIISGCAFAVQWTLQFHYFFSIFNNIKFNPNYWNPVPSSSNKWKDGIKSHGEKFLGSSTIFVLFTDAFHLFQAIFLNSLFLAFSLSSHITPYFWLDFIILRCIFELSFNLLFSKLLITKTK